VSQQFDILCIMFKIKALYSNTVRLVISEDLYFTHMWKTPI
jgi:hypothetical protein